uniref:Protein NRT1/ PTR FAMILY 2.7 n=1 Tax=Sedum alfredii TaxID=439688 RepID=A0A650AVH9_9MAGN|nr:Protein NRT1/ PTR FAMILY 2.7 [Sedum alfredii]
MGDSEAGKLNHSGGRGGWITFFFITGSFAGSTVAASGWSGNLIVYLIDEFNIKSIDAAQISNVVNGCISLFPVIGAIIADSLGCFSVIATSLCISSLGILLICLNTFFTSLRPPPCQTGSATCEGATGLQLTILFTGITLASLGIGGTRYTTATMGANQFDNPKQQDIFFNWYFFTMYTASIVSGTVIVYVQDSVSWAWGFGICLICNTVGFGIFLFGKRFYRYLKPQGSPFIGIARVVVAAVHKRKEFLSSKIEDYYYGETEGKPHLFPSENLRFLNCAAMKAEGDLTSDGVVAKPWRLCTVQQLEDFKSVIRILPLWSTTLLLAAPIVVMYAMVILQALVMDRQLFHGFKIPPASVLVIVLLSTAIFLSVIDRVLFPIWLKVTGHCPTPFQRIGTGHVFNILGMAIAALVEAKRLGVVKSHHLQNQKDAVVPMLSLWLFPQLIAVGVGEAFHFPGQVALYYQEFPVSLKNTATAMVAMMIGVSYYVGTAVIDVVRRNSSWLPDDINVGRLDNMYWLMVVLGVVNFGCYLVCTKLYKLQKHVPDDDDIKVPTLEQ